MRGVHWELPRDKRMNEEQYVTSSVSATVPLEHSSKIIFPSACTKVTSLHPAQVPLEQLLKITIYLRILLRYIPTSIGSASGTIINMGRYGAPDHSRISAVDGIRTRAIPAGNHWFIRPALLAALPPRHSMEYISIHHKTNDSS